MMLSFPRVSCFAAAVLTVCVLLRAQQPQPQEIGELYATDASVLGSVILASGGTKVLSGSSVVAGQKTALLRLNRGGDVRFCPRTSVSIASTPTGGSLMLGMNSGELEVNYSLADASIADALVTPDFRLLLQGPGKFHFAIGADKKGNTCVRPLEGNTGSVTVTELMGDTSYLVRPTEEILFRAGRLAQRQRALPTDCGCPEALPVLRASNPEPVLQSAEAPVASSYADTAARPQPEQTMAAVNSPARPPEIHLQMDAPFVYNATDADSEIETVTRLRITPVPRYPMNVAPPPVPDTPVEAMVRPQQTTALEKPRGRSFLRRVGSFFSSIFR
jgi:hypothetical protein